MKKTILCFIMILIIFAGFFCAIAFNILWLGCIYFAAILILIPIAAWQAAKAITERE